MLVVSDNIVLSGILLYTPEMNPIEQIWRELRTQGFHKEAFPSLNKGIDCLCNTMNGFTYDTDVSITRRLWISIILNQDSMTS